MNLMPLGLEHREFVTDYLRRFPPEVSELTFTNLFVWRLSRPVWLCEVERTLVFMAEDRHDERAPVRVLLGPPVGPAAPERIADRLRGEAVAWERLDRRTAEALRAAGLAVEPDPDNSDYIYGVADLAGLEGRRYHNKRNLVDQCLAAYSCRYEPVTPAVVAECAAMQDSWCEARHCGLDPGLCREYAAIRELFAHYAELGVMGGAIRVDGRIQAYAIAEALAPGTAVWHFEKAMPAIHGLGQLITHWFAREALGNFEYVNREQDLGIPGLRQAKRSLYPRHLVDKFRCALAMGDRPGVGDPRECVRREAPDAAPATLLAL